MPKTFLLIENSGVISFARLSDCLKTVFALTAAGFLRSLVLPGLQRVTMGLSTTQRSLVAPLPSDRILVIMAPIDVTPLTRPRPPTGYCSNKRLNLVTCPH